MSEFPKATAEQLLEIKLRYTTTALDGSSLVSVKKLCKQLQVDYPSTLQISRARHWKEEREANILVFESAVNSRASELAEAGAVDAVQIRSASIKERADFLSTTRQKMYKMVQERIDMAVTMTPKEMLALASFVQGEEKMLERQLITSVELAERLHRQRSENESGTTASLLDELGITHEVLEALGALTADTVEPEKQNKLFGSIDEALAAKARKVENG